jgi:hypothetical protein
MNNNDKDLNHDPATGIFDMLSRGFPPLNVDVLLFLRGWYVGQYRELKVSDCPPRIMFYEDGTGAATQFTQGHKWLPLPKSR